MLSGFLHHSDGLKVCRLVECVSSNSSSLNDTTDITECPSSAHLSQFDETSGYIKSTSEVRERETFVNRTDVRYAITTVDYNTSEETCR